MLDIHIASEMTQKRCNSGSLWGMGLQVKVWSRAAGVVVEPVLCASPGGAIYLDHNGNGVPWSCAT